MRALDLAGYLVQKCTDNSYPITNLQLQKILYFVQLGSLKKNLFFYEKTILSDSIFEAWRFGPVISDVYYAYFLNAGMPINKIADNTILPKDVPNYVDSILSRCVAARPWDLVAISHRKGGAWELCYDSEHKNAIDRELIIKDSHYTSFVE